MGEWSKRGSKKNSQRVRQKPFFIRVEREQSRSRSLFAESIVNATKKSPLPGLMFKNHREQSLFTHPPSTNPFTLIDISRHLGYPTQQNVPAVVVPKGNCGRAGCRGCFTHHGEGVGLAEHPWRISSDLLPASESCLAHQHHRRRGSNYERRPHIQCWPTSSTLSIDHE